jgi:predicted phage terminase large subunit-like protein
MAFKKRNTIETNLPARIMMEKVQREMARRRRDSVKSFSEWLHEACPTEDWNWDLPHLLYVQNKLEEVESGHIKRLMIFMPPQHGKSSLVTIRYPAYLLEKNPRMRIVVTGYAGDLAETFSKDIRGIVRERGIVEMDEAQQAVGKWMTRQGGGLKAVGVEGGITGFPADLIIIDDPVKNSEEANSKARREATNRWFERDLYTRQQIETPIIIIQTRWHEDDLSGHLLAENDRIEDPQYKWTVISLPAIAEGTDPEDYPVQREVGDALCPQLHPIEQLKEIQRVQGNDFSALYQQRPAPAEGDIWKKAWFCEDKDINRPFKTVNSFPYGKKITQMWDTSLDTKQRNDPSAMVEGCMGDDGNIYVAAMVNDKLEFPQLVQRMRLEMERIGENVEICAEDKASAKPARQQIKLLGIPMIEVPAGTVDKTVRAKSVSHYGEAGHIIFVNAKGNCNHILIDQLLMFPNGKHDDLHDAFVHLLRRVTGRSVGWDSETLRELAESMR